jgi:hypothetical protein
MASREDRSGMSRERTIAEDPAAGGVGAAIGDRAHQTAVWQNGETGQRSPTIRAVRLRTEAVKRVEPGTIRVECVDSAFAVCAAGIRKAAELPRTVVDQVANGGHLPVWAAQVAASGKLSN